MSDKEIRDLDVSKQEGEDVKGGAPAPMPIEKNPGISDKRPATATGAAPLRRALATKKPKAPGRLPPN